MSLPPTWLKWGLLLLIVTMWGSSPAFTKVALEGFSPFEVVFFRLLLGCAVLWGLLLCRRQWLQLSARYLRFFLVAALFGSAIPWVLIGWGQQVVPSGLTAVLFAVMPLATILLAHFTVVGEKLTAARVLGFVIGFAGIVVLVAPELLAELLGDSIRLVPQLAILAGALCYAVNVIVSRNRPDCDPLTAATGTLTVALILSTPAMFIVSSPWSYLPMGAPHLAILALAVVGTAIPTLIFFRLVSLAGTGFTAMINYLIPVWGLLVGVVAMGEAFEWHAAIALVLILGGITLSERDRPARPER